MTGVKLAARCDGLLLPSRITRSFLAKVVRKFSERRNIGAYLLRLPQADKIIPLNTHFMAAGADPVQASMACGMKGAKVPFGAMSMYPIFHSALDGVIVARGNSGAFIGQAICYSSCGRSFANCLLSLSLQQRCFCF
jgi:hypothetical protein